MPPRRRRAVSSVSLWSLGSRRASCAALALGLLAGGAAAQSSGGQPETVTMAVSFGPEIASRAGDGAARLGMVCAVTEYPLRSDPRYTLREPFLVAEIDSDAEAFVFYGARETRRLRAVFAANGARMRWSPQEMDRVRPQAGGDLTLDAILDLPREGADARRWRAEATILFADELRNAQGVSVSFANPYQSGRSIEFEFGGEGFAAWAEAAHDLMRGCGLRGDGRSVPQGRLQRVCRAGAGATARFLVDYESRRILEALD